MDYNNVVTKTKIPSIRLDLEKLNIEVDIRNKAEEIYCLINSPVRREKKRLMMIFFCIYYAYQELGIQKDPNDIAFIIGLRKKHISEALKIFGKTDYGQNFVFKKIEPESFIENYFEITNLSQKHINEVKDIMFRILVKDPKLKSEIQPQRFAVAVIIYFLTCNGISFNLSEFESKLGISFNTINNVIKIITKIDNL